MGACGGCKPVTFSGGFEKADLLLTVFSIKVGLVASLVWAVAAGTQQAAAQESSDYNITNLLSTPVGPNGYPSTSPYSNNNPIQGQYGADRDTSANSTATRPIQGNGSLGSNLQTEETLEASRRNPFRQDDYSKAFAVLPPDPPTEFQKVVASSIGTMLPIYGAGLFRNIPSTFAPLDRVPVTPDYVIGPGDELLIQIWGQISLDSRFIVDRSGDIYLPHVGTIRVAGLSFGDLADHIRAQVGRLFHSFDLNVNVGQLRSVQILVVGQARRPGSYTVSSLSTLVDALFVTGGPNPQGSLRDIQLKRAGKKILDFDLYDLLLRGDKSKDVSLLPGDVIYIPAVGAQVAVSGSLKIPAIYELKQSGEQGETTVGEVLDLAAGLTNVASTGSVRLERIDSHQMRGITNISLNKAGLNEIVRDGDILEVVAIVDRFKNGVTLRGNVANPGHYAWRQGMRVRDLFPDKDALITRDYWLKRGELGKPVLTFVPICPPRYLGNRLANYPENGGSSSNAVGNGVWSQYGLHDESVPSPSHGAISPQSRSEGGYLGDSTDQQDTDGCLNLPDSMALSDNSGVTTRAESNQQAAAKAYSNRSGGPADRLDNSWQATAPSASSSSAASAIVGSAGQFPVKNDVRLSEPDIDWSYAVVERQDKETLTTSLLSFNLGALVLSGDATQNLLLQPDDVVTVFSKADIRVPQVQQTRFVHLEGEFVASGIYSVKTGETLKQLVKRAGGFTSDAYLYGSEFTRESTRRVQQQRLDEYVNQIALQSGTNSAHSASRAVSAIDTAAASAMAAQSQGVIESLRRARSTGRIVLELRPDSDSADDLPDIPLEDGDRFVVPHVPSTVGVAGAVYNANSFVYDGRRRLEDYLRLAGGANRDADRKSTYVIRADGSVMSRRQVSNWRKDSFDALKIYPGDTVVIPLNLSKGASLRNVVDIAQIAGQFGVAIAAANLVF